MNLNSAQPTGPARSPAAAQAARPAGGLDVTISDGGVSVDGARVPAGGADQGGAARPAVEVRLMTAIAAPRERVPAAAAAAPAANAVVGVTEAPTSSAPAEGRALGMYTGRGRVASMPREGLAGQLIDVTG